MRSRVKLINSATKKIEGIYEIENNSLREVLLGNGVVDFPCSGRGVCGKCKIKIKEKINYNKEELKHLSDDEIKRNIHLACKVNIDKEVTIYIEEKKEFSVLKTNSIKNIIINTGVECVKSKEGRYLLLKDNKVIRDSEEQIQSYGIAVDIGTTTVVVYMYNLISGEYVDSIASINYQRTFGYDVMSRISYASTKEKLDQLNFTIVNEINEMVKELINKHNIKSDNINNMVVAANTTMNHLFLGYDIEGLGKAPFTPKFLSLLRTRADNVGLRGFEYLDIIVLNNLSSFVGGDLVSGIIDTDLDLADEKSMLVDIGTNGEMVLGNKEKIICCATAAGPAFEAVNISCGIGSVEGAIYNVYKDGNNVKYKTIGNKKPVGICGTGLIDLVAYLLDEELIDETGYMEEDFEVCQGIVIKPKDIREIQLAKSAIRAGIDCLLEEEKLNIRDIENIFISGGFGNYLNIESAVKIGLLPDMGEKLKSIGNSSIGGASKILLDSDLIDRCIKLNKKSVYIELSSNKNFMDKYIENMMF